jgi:hypothetical protein
MANKRQFFIGLIMLAIGTMFYFVGRTEGSSYLQGKLAQADKFFHHVPKLFGGLGGSFPEFVHPFAFSLMAIGFEIGQGCGSFIGEYIPQWCNRAILIENIDNYFSEGTFALTDLIAILLGSTLAFLAAELTLPKQGRTNERLAETTL